MIVGFETFDDAGVYRLNDEQALVSTVDFITPPVDDPFVFGQIAAANSLSDIYAMGGVPISCLNLVGFPSDKLEPEILEKILSGALERVHQAGAVLLGGHSIEDEEPKFGLAVTGLVHPDLVWRNNGARPGDRLILTKPLGSGVLFNANLKGWVSRKALDTCIEILAELNDKSAEAMKGFNVHAVTDITGFGLAGHCLEMAQGSGVTIEVEFENLPFMQEAREMYERGISTRANGSNRRMVEAHVSFPESRSPNDQEILLDPQTSGGLLASVPEEEAEALLNQLHQSGITHASLMGRVLPREEISLRFH